jgi:hypothetical protein
MARLNLNQALSGGGPMSVEGTGQLDVNVRAPQGTGVKAAGGGIFQRVNLRRNNQMPATDSGPPQTTPFGRSTLAPSESIPARRGGDRCRAARPHDRHGDGLEGGTWRDTVCRAGAMPNTKYTKNLISQRGPVRPDRVLMLPIRGDFDGRHASRRRSRAYRSRRHRRKPGQIAHGQMKIKISEPLDQVR